MVNAIKAADRIAAYYEATRLAGFTQEEAERYFGRPTGLPRLLAQRLAELSPWPTAEAQQRYLVRFGELWARSDPN